MQGKENFRKATSGFLVYVKSRIQSGEVVDNVENEKYPDGEIGNGVNKRKGKNQGNARKERNFRE